MSIDRRSAKGLDLSGDTIATIRRLWTSQMKAHWRTLAVVLACIALVAGATGLYPVLIKHAFDAFTAKDTQAILYAPLFVIAVTSVRGFSLLAQTVLTNRVVTQVEADMQTELYGHLIDADLAQLAEESPAALTQRFTTDFAFIKEALTRISTVFLRDVAQIIALVVAMLWIDPVLTIAAALVVPLAAIPIGKIGKKLRRVANSTQEQTGAMAGLISESLTGARVAKTFRLESYLKHRAWQAFDEVRKLKMKAANARGRLDPLLEVGGGIAVAGVLVLIGLRISSGESTVGEFTGFVTALLLAAQPMRSIGNLNAIVQEAMAALKRYYAVIDRKPTIVDRSDARPLVVKQGDIVFDNVNFSYGGDTVALSSVSLRAPAGAVTALVGRSGSGKSSLLALVPRLYDVTSGMVRIDGMDVRDATLESLRNQIGVVSQDVLLFDDTVRANIAFGRPGASDAEIEAAAAAAAADGFISKLPQGYSTMVGHGGARLSGGERQRISLARAILKDAPILLLDEATSALDAESEQIVQTALAKLMRGRTTLVIAHRLATVREADQIVVMDHGRIVEVGGHGALMEAGGVYARLSRMQLLDDSPVA